MSIQTRNVRRGLGRADERTRLAARDAQDTVDEFGERGRLLKRRAGRSLRRGARAAGDLAEETGDRLAYQARNVRRQARRHPATSAGIVLATIGIAVTVVLLWNRQRSED